MRHISNETLNKLVLAKKIVPDEVETPDEESDQHPLFAQTEALNHLAEAISSASLQSNEQIAHALSQIIRIIGQQNKLLETLLLKSEPADHIVHFDIHKGADGRISRVVPVRGK